LTRAVEIDPANVAAQCGLAVVLTESGRPSEAVAALSRALERSPQSVPVLNNLGLAYLKLGRVSEAVEALQKAAVLAPNDQGTHQNMRMAIEEARKAGVRRERTGDPAQNGGP